MYRHGQGGVIQNYSKAFKWARKAADQGNTKAQDDLAGMFFHGQGVPQDYSKALKWTRKAADQGDITAQYGLGLMYQLGQGTPQEFTEAYKWFSLAASQGFRAAVKEREELRDSKMTPDQITEAERRVAEWNAEHPTAATPGSPKEDQR